jgi:hypothetical protein
MKLKQKNIFEIAKERRENPKHRDRLESYEERKRNLKKNSR